MADLEPMPSDVLRALELERARPGLSPERQRALAARIAGAVSALPAPGSSGPAPAATSAARASLAGARGAWKLVGLLAATAAAGGAAGAGLHAALAPARVETVYVQVPVPAPPPAAPEPRDEEVRPAVPAPAVAPSAKKPAADEGLSREREILELARGALARGHAPEALEAIQRHEKQFPKGRLAEERESIAIQALLAAGRVDEARRRGEAFRRAYPESLLRPLVDTLLEKAR